MANSVGKTAAGNLRCAKYSDVCNWVKHLWKNIFSETIINSFVNYGITELLDNNNEEFEILDIDDDINNNTDNDNKIHDNEIYNISK